MNKINGTRPLARYEIAADAVINCGDLVALNGDGKAVPASESVNITVIGYAENIDSGAVEVGDGVVALAGGTTDTITRADRGKAAYVEDATHIKTTGGTAGVPAGIIVDVYGDDIYVDTTPAAIKAAKGN